MSHISAPRFQETSLSAGRPPCGPPGLLRRRGRLRPGSARPATAGRRRARSRCSSRWRRWRLRRQKSRRTALRRLSSFVFCRISHTRLLSHFAHPRAPRGHEPSAIRSRSQKLLARTAADSAIAAAAVELFAEDWCLICCLPADAAGEPGGPLYYKDVLTRCPPAIFYPHDSEHECDRTIGSFSHQTVTSPESS